METALAQVSKLLAEHGFYFCEDFDWKEADQETGTIPSKRAPQIRVPTSRVITTRIGSNKLTLRVTDPETKERLCRTIQGKSFGNVEVVVWNADGTMTEDDMEAPVRVAEMSFAYDEKEFERCAQLFAEAFERETGVTPTFCGGGGKDGRFRNFVMVSSPSLARKAERILKRLGMPIVFEVEVVNLVHQRTKTWSEWFKSSFACFN